MSKRRRLLALEGEQIADLGFQVGPGQGAKSFEQGGSRSAGVGGGSGCAHDDPGLPAEIDDRGSRSNGVNEISKISVGSNDAFAGACSNGYDFGVGRRKCWCCDGLVSSGGKEQNSLIMTALDHLAQKWTVAIAAEAEIDDLRAFIDSFVNAHSNIVSRGGGLVAVDVDWKNTNRGGFAIQPRRQCAQDRFRHRSAVRRLGVRRIAFTGQCQPGEQEIFYARALSLGRRVDEADDNSVTVSNSFGSEINWGKRTHGKGIRSWWPRNGIIVFDGFHVTIFFQRTPRLGRRLSVVELQSVRAKFVSAPDNLRSQLFGKVIDIGAGFECHDEFVGNRFCSFGRGFFRSFDQFGVLLERGSENEEAGNAIGLRRQQGKTQIAQQKLEGFAGRTISE